MNKSVRSLCVPEFGLENQPIVVSVWLVKSGTPIREGEPLVELHAGAATLDLPAPTDGVLHSKLVTEGATVVVGQQLAEIEAL